MRSLPLLANALGKSYGIKVKVGGTQAFTNGSTINIPSFSPEGDPTFLGLVRGYIDHEAAHIRYTDFECLQQVTTPLEKHVWNILEDWRVESKLAELFPGCRQNFNWLIKHVFLREGPETKDLKPESLILNWLLLTVRSWDVPELQEVAQGLEIEIDSMWPGLRTDMKSILSKLRLNSPDSTAILMYAKELITLLSRMYQGTNIQQNQKPDIQEKGLNSHVQNNAGSSCEKNYNSSGLKLESHHDEFENTLSKEEHLKHGKKDISQVCPAQHLKNLLNASEYDLPENLGAILAKSLEQIAVEKPSELEVATIGQKRFTTFDAESMDKVRKSMAGMRAKFHALMQSSKLTRTIPARRGDIDKRILHRVVTGNPRIFIKRSEKQGINTAVHILLDCSGSMRKRIKMAGQVCQVVATALYSVGVNVGVTAFPGDNEDGNSFNTVAPIVNHGESVHSKFNLSASGQTPMGEAIWWVLQQMVVLPENRKIILVVTDGSPDSIKNTREAITAGRNLGIEFHGLGINSQEICHLIPESSRNLKELSELGPATFKLFSTALSS